MRWHINEKAFPLQKKRKERMKLQNPNTQVHRDFFLSVCLRIYSEIRKKESSASSHDRMMLKILFSKNDEVQYLSEKKQPTLLSLLALRELSCMNFIQRDIKKQIRA